MQDAESPVSDRHRPRGRHPGVSAMLRRHVLVALCGLCTGRVSHRGRGLHKCLFLPGRAAGGPCQNAEVSRTDRHEPARNSLARRHPGPPARPARRPGRDPAHPAPRQEQVRGGGLRLRGRQGRGRRHSRRRRALLPRAHARRRRAPGWAATWRPARRSATGWGPSARPSRRWGCCWPTTGRGELVRFTPDNREPLRGLPRGLPVGEPGLLHHAARRGSHARHRPADLLRALDHARGAAAPLRHALLRGRGAARRRSRWSTGTRSWRCAG